jgi:prevent-host-death family protein
MEASLIEGRNPQRSITARELWRQAASILDEVEFERRVILVTRSGRPVALLTPLPPARKDRVPELGQDADELEAVEVEGFELELVLAAARRAPRPWWPQDSLDRGRETAIALTRLEFKKLLKKEFSGAYHVTPLGAKIATRYLDERKQS